MVQGRCGTRRRIMKLRDLNPPLIFPMELRYLNLMEGAPYKYLSAGAGLGKLI